MKHRAKISLNALRTFEAVARLGNMTRAATELGVTPGAISRQISELQVVLNFDLFDGTHKNQVVTHSGHQLASTLTKSLDDIDATLRALDPSKDRLLDVACLSTSAIRWLIPKLHHFRELHSEIDLRLSTDPRPPNKLNNRVDVSITVLSPDQPVQRQDTILFPETLGPVLRPDLVKREKISCTEDLFRLLHLTTKTRPLAWDNWQAGYNFPSDLTMGVSEFDHLSIAIEAAANGLGFCIAPHHLVEMDIANGRLAAPIGFKKSGFTYVMREHGRRKPKVEKFVNWLSQDVAI